MLEKVQKRLKRHRRVRAKIAWTASRPRLAVFRSNVNIYVQLIDDVEGKTLAAASDIKITDWTKTARAEKVWEEIAKKAAELKISEVVFDKWGFAYHGRVKALADSARKAWLKF